MITDPIAKALVHAEIDITSTIAMIEATANGDTCHGLRQTLGLIRTARVARQNFASVVKKVADWIDNNDPFGDQFSAYDLEQLRALEKALAQ